MASKLKTKHWFYIVPAAIILVVLLSLVVVGPKAFAQKAVSFMYQVQYARFTGGAYMASLLSLTQKSEPAFTVSSTTRVDYVPVLVYAGVSEAKSTTTVAKSDFALQMFALKSAGFVTVSVDDLVGGMEKDNKWPANSVLLVLADGQTSADKVAPILDAVSFKASTDTTFFGNVGDLVRRIDVVPGDDVIRSIANVADKSLPYADEFSSDNGWLAVDGSVDISPSRLAIKSDVAQGAQGSVFLRGGKNWQDYFVIAQTTLDIGGSFSLIARHDGGASYVACNYGENQITLAQYINGKPLQLGVWNGDYGFNLAKKLDVGMYVVGNKAGCVLGDKLAVSAPFSTTLDKGSVSFQVYGEYPWRGNLVVNKVETKSVATDFAFSSLAQLKPIITVAISKPVKPVVKPPVVLPPPVIVPTSTPTTPLPEAPKTFEYTADLRNESSWKPMFGNILFKGDYIQIGANNDLQGGSLYVNDSANWKDYSYDAQVTAVRGTRVVMAARYKDENNFISCSFALNEVRLEQKVNGKTTLMNRLRIRVPELVLGTSRFGVKVEGNRADCLFNGGPVLGDDIASKLDKGGIAIRTWDPLKNNSSVNLIGLTARGILTQ